VHRLASAFVLGYHGCDRRVGERLVAGETFKNSNNAYDWLGPGVYFWEANPRRGLEFAREQVGRGKVLEPDVVGAIIDLGLCLDLTTSAGIAMVQAAHGSLIASVEATGGRLPKNTEDGLRRPLDCAVITRFHAIRDDAGEIPVDSVRGVFVEGDEVYPGAGFREKTHVQLCIRNLDCIKGVFRVPRHTL